MSFVNELTALRDFYNSGATRSYAFRRQQLLLLKAAIEKYEQEIYEALYTDLKKSKEECYVTENGFLLTEINHTLKHLSGWMQPQKVSTNLLNLPSTSYIMKEPLGVVLIIGPWNYPLQLLLMPVVGAIAAGNCMAIKPSEHAPATAALIKKIIREIFPHNYMLITEGDGAQIVPAMMNEFIFDHVFFTGSIAVGKMIYQLAAKELVPVTLELGGKSACVVESDAAIMVAARRIAMAKFSNVGQMCVAPDYVLVHQSQKEAFITALKKVISDFFGANAQQSESYGKIINERQLLRIVSYFKDGEVIFGGNYDLKTLYIEPTLLDKVNANSAVMQEEIFGPLLPIIGFEAMSEALSIIEKNKNPLAFYIFTSSKTKENEWLEKVAFGGGCVNNTSLHLTNHQLPFGGRGASGIGKYHGKYSFDTFSHEKSILKTPNWFDPSLKYPPYKGRLRMFKWLIR